MDSPLQKSPAQLRRLAQFGVQRCVDVHSHCLPGIDDGPATLPEAIELCRELIEDGVTSVVATPHQLGAYDGLNLATEVQLAVDQLTTELIRLGLPLEIAAAGDVRIDERLCDLMSQGIVTTVNGNGAHLLLELPFECLVDPTEVLDSLAKLGVQTILTHPERYRYLDGRMDLIERWVGQGAVMQITSGSLLGEFGRTAARMAWEMIELDLVDLVASDAHGCENRPPRMTSAIEILADRAGMDLARRLCGDNPQQVWLGEHIRR